jgi:transposase
MPQNLPQQILQRIVRLSADGNSQREVARMLGVSQGCVSKILRRNRETGRPHQRKRGGSMKISTPREDRQLLRMVRTNRFISAPRLRMQMIRRFRRRMSVRTIRRRLLAAGYWSRRPARCPRLTLEHRRRRREWGRRHRVWDHRQWRHCIFSDESRFSLYHSDGRVRVRRRQGERLIDACVQLTDGNRRPSVMVWGAIHHGGRSELVVVDGPLNRHGYIQILRDQMLPWATGVFGRNFVYVQDNAPPHTARDTAAFLDQQDVEVMDWPARSPDMNPIEHVWDQMSVWIRDMDDPPSTVAELQNAVRQAWAAVRPGRVRTLVESMPRRVRALMAARGGHTRY